MASMATGCNLPLPTTKGNPIVGKSLMTLRRFSVIHPHHLPNGWPPRHGNDPSARCAMNRCWKSAKCKSLSNEWHSVGTETITVPAGTFSCDHYRNDTKNSDVWVSDKVSPRRHDQGEYPFARLHHGAHQNSSTHVTDRTAHHRPRPKNGPPTNNATDASRCSANKTPKRARALQICTGGPFRPEKAPPNVVAELQPPRCFL